MMIKIVRQTGVVTYINRDKIILVDEKGSELFIQLSDEISLTVNKYENAELQVLLEYRAYLPSVI